MLIRVFLCDDNKETITQYSLLIENIAKKYGIEVLIYSFKSGEEVLFYLSDSPNQADIIYMDIFMHQINGMDTAKRLRKLGCMSEFVFLTNSEDYIFDAFDISAVQYLLKSETSTNKFEEIFLRAVSLVQAKKKDMFVCESGNVKKVIPIKDISYIEILHRVVTVHYKHSESFRFYSTLELMEKELMNKGFVRVHRSYMVNLSYISKFQQKGLVLKTGDHIPVGVTYIKQVKKILSEYISHQPFF